MLLFAPRTGRLVGLITTIAVVMLPAAARGDVKLDRDFGAAGRVTTRVPVAKPLEATSVDLALAPNGRIFAAAGSTIVRYLPNGRIDRSFGAAGRVTISTAPGSDFGLAGLAVDSQGRLIVAGTLQSTPSTPSYWQHSMAVRVLRFLPNGGLDPSFGTGGAVDTDFGLPNVEGLPAGSAPISVVYATGVAVDRLGRTVITGGAVSRLAPSCIHDSFGSMPRFASYVARLTDEGALDSSFGSTGVLVDDPSGQRQDLPTFGSREPLVSRSGQITYVGERTGYGQINPDCDTGTTGLVRLRRNGASDAGFGVGGLVPFEGVGPEALADDGGTFVIGTVRSVLTFRAPQGLTRLTAEGKVDRRFGSHGSAALESAGPGGRSGFGSVATGLGGETFVAGTGYGRAYIVPHKGVRLPVQKWLALSRIDPSGRIDRSVGNDGVLVTRFGKRSYAFARDIVVDRRGRPVIAGVDRGGLILTRYVVTR